MSSPQSPLGQVLHEYAIPLQVWLGPGARRGVAARLIDTLGSLADVQNAPLQGEREATGPAVLVMTPDDMRSESRDALLALAERAYPGRVVLVGGTSDRDILMDAINTWRAIRVVSANAPAAELMDAVRAAGESMRNDVALATAIDDLGVETTMLEAAISQLSDGHGRSVAAERDAAKRTIAEGLARTFATEQAALEGLTATEETDSDSGESLRKALVGVRSLTDLLEKVHDRTTEQSAGRDVPPERVDALVARAAELSTLATKHTYIVTSHTTAMTTADPYALTHILVHCLNAVATDAAGPTTIDTSMDGGSVRIRIEDATTRLDPSAFAQRWTGALQTSHAILSADGTRFDRTTATAGDGQDWLLITLPQVDAQ